MGISGLNSFFDSNPHLSKPHRLHNTRVIIDGNNLANALYFDCQVGCVHGGDYNRYATVIKDYLSLYLQCGVEPVVILDGGYDKTDNKLRTVIQRANRRLKAVNRIAKQESFSGHVLPPFAFRVFIDILKEMGIRYAQCPFEADAEITAIANYYQCPVISVDSDFYIFDIHFGFIRLDYIDVKIQNGTDDKGQLYYFLNCVIYHVDSFLSFFPGVQKQVLPLFSMLTGNDFADVFAFSDFFQNVQLPRVETKNLHVSERHHQMIGILLWLQHHDVDSAIEEVLKHVRRKESVKRAIKQAADVYDVRNSNFVEYFDSVSFRSSVYPSCCLENLFTFKNNPLPRWFAEWFYEASLCPFLLNAVGLRRVFLQCLVEDTSLSSTYASSLWIRQVLYGLLLSSDGVSEENCDENRVEEYDRVGNTLHTSCVVPVFSVPGFGTLPKLSEQQLDTESASLLLLHTLGERSEFLDDLPDFLELYVMSVRYCLKNCSPKLSENFLDALLVTTVFLSIAEPLVPAHSQERNVSTFDYEKFSRDDFKKASILHVIERVSSTNARFFKKNLQMQFIKPKHSKNSPLCLPLIHNYSQLQGCLYFVIMLNELVGSPFLTPKIQSLFSGTLMYNFAHKLSKHGSPDSFIRDTVGSGSALAHLFKKLKKKLVKNLPVDCLKLRSKLAGRNLTKPGVQTQKKFAVGLSNRYEILTNGCGGQQFFRI